MFGIIRSKNTSENIATTHGDKHPGSYFGITTNTPYLTLGYKLRVATVGIFKIYNWLL